MGTPVKKNLPAKAEEKAIAGQMPEFLRKGSGLGAEKVRQKDLVIPRVKLLQGNNPEVVDSDGAVKPGTLMNSVTKVMFGKTMQFLPVIFFVSRIKWRPMGEEEEGGGMECQARDGENPSQPPKGCGPLCSGCPMALWNDLAKVKKDRQPKCTEYYNFLGFVKGQAQPIVLSMERTKVPAAKKILSLNRYSGANLDLFSRWYIITATGPHKDDKGNPYFSLDADGGPWVTEPEYKLGLESYKSLSQISYTVHQDQDGSKKESEAAPKNF